MEDGLVFFLMVAVLSITQFLNSCPASLSAVSH